MLGGLPRGLVAGVRGSADDKLVSSCAENVLPEVVGNGSDRSRATRLGLALGRKRGRIFVGRRLQEVDVTDDDSRLRTAWASCPPLPRHAAETWNVWTSGNRPKSHKTRSLHRNVLLPAEEGLESQALIDR